MSSVATFDIAAGVVLGVDPPSTAPASPAADSPLAALESAVLPALLRPPCLVSFSGGLDSSLVLAVAVRVARRHGLPDPVPFTWRYPDVPRTDESSWQERIVDVLGVREHWQIQHVYDELDLVGEVARRFLHRYGLRHPVNLHVHLPIIELARGGALLTGAGGDQVLAGWRRPAPRTAWAYLRRAAGAVRRLGRRPAPLLPPMPWLRPEVAVAVAEAYRAEVRAEPHRLDRRVAWHLRRRDLRTGIDAFALVSDDHDVLPVHPLLDPGFVAALTGWAGRRWRPARVDLLAGIAAGQLPEVIVAARRKANFLGAFLRTPTREFVRSWDGAGVDETLVDPAGLRTVWSHWPIPAGTMALVQQLWLVRHPPVQSPTTEVSR